MIGLPRDRSTAAPVALGTVTVSDTPPHALPTVQGATIVADIPCFFCQYNLRTLSIDGNCPECGHAVGECIRWLVFCDPRWLSKLRTGVTIFLWLPLAVLLSYVGFVVYWLLRAMPAIPSDPPDLFVMKIASSVFGIGVASAWLAGIWYLTSTEPVSRADPRRSKLPVWIRVLNAVSIAVTVIAVLFSFAVFTPNDPGLLFETWGVASIVVLVTSVAGQGAFAVGLVLLVVHMRRVARREIKKGLARLMTFLLWGGVALSVGFGGSLVVLGLAGTMFAATAALVPVTTASTTQASSTVSAAGYTTGEYVLPWGNVRASQAGVATTSAPAATTGPAGTPSAPLVALGYVTTTAAATTMPAVAAPMPFGRGFMIWAFAMCASQLLAFGWLISGVVALFWFRSVFKRAIRQQTGPPPMIAPVTAH